MERAIATMPSTAPVAYSASCESRGGPAGLRLPMVMATDIEPGPTVRGIVSGKKLPMPLTVRSEEHTSELQSPCISYAVFCLKKKKKKKSIKRNTYSKYR